MEGDAEKKNWNVEVDVITFTTGDLCWMRVIAWEEEA